MNIGSIQLSHPFCQAGLAGYSDRAMRLVARRRGCPYAVTEALLDTILLSGGQGLKRSIDINDEDHPIAGQIIGSDGETMSRAARILHDRDYDVIDLNFACPVKKIKNKARGGHMLMDVPRGVSILRAVRDAIPAERPLTVSLRRGFDDSQESEDRFFQLIEEAWRLGFAAIRVHARTVEQKYLGPSRWPFLADLKSRYPNRTIFGSGDLFTAEDVVRMLKETRVDIAWIARGAIGNPWIFRQAAALLSGSLSPPRGEGWGEGTETRAIHEHDLKTEPLSFPSPPPSPRDREREEAIRPPSIHEQRDALAEHFSIAMQIHGESLAGRRMRKMGIKYSRFHPMHEQVKTDFIAVHSLRDWTNVLTKWYAHDGDGFWPDARAADEVNATADMQTCEVEA